MGPYWGHLGASWGLLGASWGHLGGDRSKKGGPSISAAPREPPESPLGPLLRRSWSALGRSWAVLGLSWAPLGAILGHLGALKARRKRKCEKSKHAVFFQFWKVFCLFGASLGGSVAIWSSLGLVLELLGGTLCAIFSHVGLSRSWRSSWAFLGPLGAVLGHLRRSDRSRGAPSRSRGGGRAS